MVFHFTVASDPDGNYSIFEEVLQAIASSTGPGVFHVSCGDNYTTEINRAAVDAILGTDTIWYTVVGNHEAGLSAEMNWLRNEYENGNGIRTPLKNYTNQDGPSTCKETTYSWDYGNVHFIVINEYWDGSNDHGTDGNVVQALLDWLNQDLTNNTQPFVFIFGHEPAFPHNFHTEDSLNKYPSNRDAFWDLLEYYNVQAYFCGHTHVYFRQQGDDNGIGNVWQINVGNAGSVRLSDGQTFLNITVDETQALVDVYRDEETNSYSYYETITLAANGGGGNGNGGNGGMSYYVATNGNDSNPGTEAQPWRTIGKAASTMVAGDTVYIKEGTYGESVRPANSGNSGGPITYAPYGSDTVTIDALGKSHGVDINSKSWIVLGGDNRNNRLRIINATNGDSAGVRLNGNATHCTLRNLYIDNTGIGGIHAMSAWYPTIPLVTHLLVDGCELTRTNQAHNQEAFSLLMVDNFEIKNCYIHDTVKEGIDMKHGCSNGLVHDNEISAKPGIYFDARGHEYNIKVYNNIVHDCDYGITLANEAGGESGALEEIDIYNNVVYGNGRGITTFNYSGAQIHTVRILNNTLYQNSNAQIKMSQTGMSGWVIRNNILIGSSPIDNSGGSPYTEDHNITSGDPRFVNASGRDFHLQSDSPAIDAGSSSLAPNFDFDYIPRPQGSGYDIGAYEYVGSVPPPQLTADFTANPVSGNAPLTVQFIDKSVGEITLWQWDFGDGGTSDQPDPSHMFQEGSYTVTLTVSDSINTDSASITITVTPGSSNGVITDISIYPTFVCAGIKAKYSGSPGQVTTEYRRQGDTAWINVTSPLPNDPSFPLYNDTGRNELRGSLFWLDPNTNYELRLTDSQGYKTVTFRTRNDNPPSTGNVTTLNPGQSIASALNSASPGDIIQLHGGNYSGFETSKNGQAGNYITVEAYPGEIPYVTGEVNIYGAYLRFRGIHSEGVNPGSQWAVWVLNGSGCHDNIFEQMEIRHVNASSSSCFRINNGAYDNLIQDCILQVRQSESSSGDYDDADGVYWWNPGEGNVIRRNKVYGGCDGFGGGPEDTSGGGQAVCNNFDMYDNEIYRSFDDGIQVEGGVINTRVWGNLMIDCMLGFTDACTATIGPYYIFRNVVCTHSTIRGVGNNGLFAQGDNGMGRGFFIHNSYWGVSGSNGIYAKNGSVYNNCYINNAVYATRYIIEFGHTNDGNGCYFDYNLMGTGGIKLEGNAQFGSHETHGPEPDYVDPDNGDLSPVSGGNLIDGGMIIKQFNDALSPWPAEVMPNIGAIESGGGGPPPPDYYTLTIQKQGLGTTSPAAGSYTYEEGYEVLISATPAQNYEFGGWWEGSDLISQNQDITVSMISDKTITAIFNEAPVPQHTLTINVEPSGGGEENYRVESRTQLPYGAGDCCAAIQNGYLYIIGGFRANDTDYLRRCQRYDPNTNQWTQMAQMPTGRWGLAAAIHNGVIYTFGGEASGDLYSTIVEAYNINTNTWSSKAPFPLQDRSIIAVTVGNYIYLFTTDLNFPQRTFRYDPATDTYTSMTSPPESHGYGAGVYVNVNGEDRIYLMSGGGSDNICRYYRVEADSWSGELAPLPPGKGYHRHGTARENCYYNGGIYFAVGFDDSAFWDEIYRYDIGSDSWRVVGNCQARDGCAGGFIGNVFYIIGGRNQISNSSGLATNQVLIVEGGGGSSSGTTNPAPGSHNYPEGTVVPVDAINNPGWLFDRWEENGQVLSENSGIDVEMHSNRNITAYFKEKPVTPSAYLTITALAGGTTNPEPDIYEYELGEQSELITAIEAEGYVFEYWDVSIKYPDGTTEAYTSDQKSISVQMDGDVSLAAHFKTEPEVWYYLHLDVTPVGSGQTNPEVGSHPYLEKTSVPVEAIPGPNWRLKEWQEDGIYLAGPESNPIQIIMNSNRWIKAVFEEVPPVPHTVTLVAGVGGTTIPQPDDYPVEDGDSFTIEAVPYEGYKFVGWQESVVNTENPYTIEHVISNMTIKAEFALKPQPSGGSLAMGVGMLVVTVVTAVAKTRGG